MTKRQAENYARLREAMEGRLGISPDDFNALLRIERTLSRWSERECGDEYGNAIERDETTGKPFLTYDLGVNGTRGRYAIPDREKGAQRRLATIMARYPKLAAYVQGDPRGCALYVYETSKLREYEDRSRNVYGHSDAGDISCCYSSVGVAVCF